MKQPEKYTVLLLYPCDWADSFGESFLAHVESKSPHGAAKEAVRQALTDVSENIEEDLIGWEENWAVVAVFKGHHDDVAYRRQEDVGASPEVAR